MQVIGISGLHSVVEITESDKDYILVNPTERGKLTTVQSILLKTPKNTAIEFIVKSKKEGNAPVAILNIEVPEDATQIINVKQQLPETISMLITASAAGGVVTLNGVIAELG